MYKHFKRTKMQSKMILKKIERLVKFGGRNVISSHAVCYAMDEEVKCTNTKIFGWSAG